MSVVSKHQLAGQHNLAHFSACHEQAQLGSQAVKHSRLHEQLQPVVVSSSTKCNTRPPDNAKVHHGLIAILITLFIAA